MTFVRATRRRFIHHSLGATLGFALARSADARWNATARAKRCVLLWMNGGPSQFETFDPKPNTATGGPTESIQTPLTGVSLAAGLPQVARRMEHLCVLRNVTSAEGEHERAQYYLHTGYRMVPAFPRPAIGSMVSHELPEFDFPKYVLLGGRGFGPAYCGPDHASFAVDNAETAQRLLGQVRRRREHLQLLRTLGADFDRNNGFSSVQRRTALMNRIERIVTTPFREALDLEAEKPETKARYGDHEFGRRCLLARRLLERGVPFVEVQLDGWDTHINNFDAVGRLNRAIDAPWGALLDDLMASGLWGETLLVWMGEFGRTPLINAQNGRDHFPTVTPVVLGGGCLQTGQVVGETDRGGVRIKGDVYQVADVAATILQVLGIPPDHEFTTSFDSPTKATDSGRVITEVL